MMGTKTSFFSEGNGVSRIVLYICRRFGEARGLHQVVLEDNFHSFLNILDAT